MLIRILALLISLLDIILDLFLSKCFELNTDARQSIPSAKFTLDNQEFRLPSFPFESFFLDFFQSELLAAGDRAFLQVNLAVIHTSFFLSWIIDDVLLSIVITITTSVSSVSC